MSVITIFDPILVRISAESISKIELNHKNEYINTRIEEYFKLENDSKKINTKLCSILYDTIQQTNDPNKRRFILNIKRKIYNSRVNDNDLLQQICSEEFHTHYAQYNVIKQRIEEVKSTINTVYTEIISAESKLISEFCQKGDFLKGLLLSSPQLFQHTKNPSLLISSKLSNEHLGLWKYISRMVTKTTPFSTFTHIALCNTNTSCESISIQEQPIYKSQTIVTYNTLIYDVILNIIKKHEIWSTIFPIRINQTVKIDHSEIIFLANNNNVEAIQKLKINDVIRTVIIIITKHKNIIYQDLVDKLYYLLDSSKLEINKYISNLINSGFLYIDIQLLKSGNNWEEKLADFIRTHYRNSIVSQQLLTILNTLIYSKLKYTQSDSNIRENILKTMRCNITEFILLLHKDANLPEYERYLMGDMSANKEVNKTYKNKKYAQAYGEENGKPYLNSSRTYIYNIKNIIYEDSKINLEITINKDLLYEFIYKLDKFINVFSFLCSVYHIDQDDVLSFYKKMSIVGSDVEFLEFYEFYYKNKNVEFEPEKIARKSLPNKKNILQMQLYEVIKGGIIPDSNEIHFGEEKLVEIESYFKKEKKNKNISYTAFIQFYEVKDNNNKSILMGVVNHIAQGNGKYYSRFLSLIDAKITKKIEDWNILKMQDQIYCENNDASAFNANIHPSLFPFEIIAPNSNYSRLPFDQQININDVSIKYNIIEDSLDLYYKKDKKISFFDLGFETASNRSSSFQLMCSFGNNNYFNVRFFTKIIDSISQKIYTDNVVGKVIFLPRIIYSETIVLQRKRWYVPVDLIKKICFSKNEVDFFTQFQKFKIHLDLPVEVFISEHSNKEVNNKENKPQYINFLSPVSVKLARKLINVFEHGILFEEMHPNSEQLINTNIGKYAAEYVVQWQ